MSRMSGYELGLCQKFNEEMHGFDENTSSPEIKEHYICLYTFSFKSTFKDYIAFAKCYGATVEIVEPIWLYPGNEMVAIYKTFWLRIFQRLCRKWVLYRRYSRSNQIYSFLMKREYQNTKIHI
jgi:hypothetical protein